MPVAPCGPAGPGTATAGPGTATAGPGTATSVGGAFTTVGLSQATKLNGTSSAAIHIEWFIGNPFVSTGSAWNSFESVASNLSRISVLPSGPQKPGSMLGVLTLVATVGRAAAQPRRTSSAPGVGHAADILPSGALPNPCTSHSAERIGSVYLSGKPRRRFGDHAGRGLGERSEQPSVGRGGYQIAKGITTGSGPQEISIAGQSGLGTSASRLESGAIPSCAGSHESLRRSMLSQASGLVARAST